MIVFKNERSQVFSAMLVLIFTAQFSWAQDQMKNISEQASVVKTDNSSLKWGPCPEFMPDGCQIAVLHGDPAKNNVDILFKLEPNSDFPEHWHNSAERMVLLSGELTVTYQGEETKTLKKGDYAYGPAKKPHSGRCGDSGPCVLFIGFEKPLDAFTVNK